MLFRFPSTCPDKSPTLPPTPHTPLHSTHAHLVEGSSEVPKSRDALAISECLRQRGAQRERDVFVRVVVVDPRVTLRVDVQVEQAVRAQLLQANKQSELYRKANLRRCPGSTDHESSFTAWAGGR